MNKAIVFSNCAEGRDDEFNRWYNDIHAPEVIEKTPIVACQRFELSDEQMGESKFRYLAIYEFEGDAKHVVEAFKTTQFDMGDTLGDAEITIFDAL